MAKNQFSYSRLRENNIFRSLVVFMCICYLLQPLNKPVSSIFHYVSHLVEIPDQFLDTSSVAHTGAELHSFHEHQIDKEDHQHKIIDFFVSVLSANESTDKPKLAVSDILETEEHLVARIISQILLDQTLSLPNWNNTSKTSTGYSVSLLKPPIA